ncbi:protein phosphatase CheZ [Thiomicrorhabdus indica]|uniref:protein phosphatase CheZ n=1 Tax=Thiomicrorhabdus indica TaxID=2267253 RepID=UPI00102D7224|nr:protein phosphatase CheZ [Thiomicrorhabdus indica]
MGLSANINREAVEQLLQAIDSGDQARSSELLDELTQLREQELYQKLSQITDNLHQTLDDLGDDSLMMQTKYDLPDASERLQYVMDATLEASEKSLANAEQIQNLLDNLPDETLTQEQQEALKLAHDNATQIILAQSFQDLTGQVLKRVMLILGSLENSLIDLIQQSGHDYDAIPQRKKSNEDLEHGIGPNVTKSSKQDAVSSQDDVDDLLDSLGI